MARALKPRLSAAILFQEICTDLRKSDVHISNERSRCLFHITFEKSNIVRALAIWNQPHFEEMPELEAGDPLYLQHFSRKSPQFYHICKLTMTVSTWNGPHSRVVCYDYTNQDSRNVFFLSWSVNTCILCLQQTMSLSLQLLSTVNICIFINIFEKLQQEWHFSLPKYKCIRIRCKRVDP